VTAGLQRDLLKPEAVTAYVAEYQAERRRLAMRDNAERDRLERRLVDIDREAERCVDRLVKGIGDQERDRKRSERRKSLSDHNSEFCARRRRFFPFIRD